MRTACTSAVLAVISLFVTFASAQVKYTPVALTGQPVPGIPGATFASIRDSVVTGPSGHVAVWATISGPGIVHGTDETLWLGRPGSLQLVARDEDPAPEVDDHAFFSSFDYRTVVSSSGQILFNSAIVGDVGDEVPDYAIYTGTPGSLKLLARSGHTISGLDPAARFQWDLWSCASNATGQAALALSIASDPPEASGQQAILAGTPGSLRFVAKAGEQAAGFPLGFVYHHIGDGSDFTIHRLTDAGQVLFSANVSQPASGDALGPAFWMATTDSVQRLVYHGQPAPGVEPGHTIRYPTLSMNASGQMGMVCGLSEDNSDDSALYVGTADNLRPIARTGQQAPGMPAGVTYRGFHSSNNPLINDTGIIAFTASLQVPGAPEGSNNRGLWFGRPDQLEFVAFADQPAPGLPDGFEFHGFEPQLNNLGQLIFRGWFHGPDVAASAGVWTLDSSGDLALLFAEGQLFDVGNGDFRTIARFQLGQLNDLGQLPFWATFTDGSTGLFMATVPEPVTLPVLLLATALLVRRSCRRTQGAPESSHR